ncbi:hypothetical protein BH23BAC3_BH23BAC3_20700 [soil metagenome]
MSYPKARPSGNSLMKSGLIPRLSKKGVIPHSDAGSPLVIKAGDATQWRGMTLIKVKCLNGRPF